MKSPQFNLEIGWTGNKFYEPETDQWFKIIANDVSFDKDGTKKGCVYISELTGQIYVFEAADRYTSAPPGLQYFYSEALKKMTESK